MISKCAVMLCLLLAVVIGSQPFYSSTACAADWSNGVDGVTINDQNASYGGAIFQAQTLVNGVKNSSFSGNSSSRGGAVYVGNLHGGIYDTLFSGNTSTSWGGAVYVNTLSGGMHGVRFLNNTAASGMGGGFYGAELLGGVHSSYFSGNTARTNGGGLASNASFTGGISNSSFVGNSAGAQGGGVYAPALTGDIFNSTFQDNRANSGGGIYLRVLNGDLRNATFSGNFANDNGGGATVDGFNDGYGIYDSLFENNSAGNAGGGLISFRMNDVVINNSRFLDNSAGRGGAIFLATDRSSSMGVLLMDVVLSADAGNQTTFQGNRDSAGPNSLYFGRYNPDDPSLTPARLTVTGQGRVELYDPIRVAMDGQDFSFIREDSSGNGEFIWGGLNRISTLGAQASFDFRSGHTTLLSNYSLAGSTGTTLNVSLGLDHAISLDLSDRDTNTPILDFTQAEAGSSLNWDTGTTIGIGRSIYGYEGRYLMIDGYDYTGMDPDDINFQNSSEVLFEAEVVGDQLWLTVKNTPRSASAYYRPNARRALRALDQLVRHTDYGLELTDAEYYAFLEDIDSSTPEAAVTMGLVSMQTHGAVVDTALRSAMPSTQRFHATSAVEGLQALYANPAHLGKTTGRYKGMGPARRASVMEKVAAETDFRPSQSLIGSWSPASPETRRELFGPYSASFSGGNGTVPSLGAAPFQSAMGMNVWMGFVGNYMSADNHRGYSGYDSTTEGMLLGLSLDLGKSWTVGGYSGFTNTETDFDRINAEGESEGLHAGLFLRYEIPCGFSLTADGAYSYFDTDVTRKPANATSSQGSFDQRVYSVGLEAAYEIQPWERGRITPFLAARHTWAEQDAYTESGGPASARVQEADTKSFTTTLGATLAQDFLLNDRVALTPGLEVAWRHEYGDRHVKTRDNYFTAPILTGEDAIRFDTYSLSRDRDTLQAGASLQLMLLSESGLDLAIKAAYGLEVSDNFTGHTVFAGFEVDF